MKKLSFYFNEQLGSISVYVHKKRIYISMEELCSKIDLEELKSQLPDLLKSDEKLEYFRFDSCGMKETIVYINLKGLLSILTALSENKYIEQLIQRVLFLEGDLADYKNRSEWLELQIKQMNAVTRRANAIIRLAGIICVPECKDVLYQLAYQDLCENQIHYLSERTTLENRKID